MKGSVTRMKKHTSSSHKNVALCAKMSEVIKEEIRAYMKKKILSKYLAKRHLDDGIDIGSFFGNGPDDKNSPSSLPTMSCRGARQPMGQIYECSRCKR